jgi:hypothetical protein
MCDPDIRRQVLRLTIEQRKVDLRHHVQFAQVLTADLQRLERELHALDEQAVADVSAAREGR